MLGRPLPLFLADSPTSVGNRLGSSFDGFLGDFLGLFFFFFFWPHHAACWILVPQPGMESGPSSENTKS